jgi:hypothetical protein
MRGRPMKALAVAVAFVLSGPTATVTLSRVAIANSADTSPVISYHAERKLYALRMPREEGLKLRAADGGKLTDAHRAYLEAKLKAIRAGNF